MNLVALADQHITVQVADPSDRVDSNTEPREFRSSATATLSERDQLRRSQDFWEAAARLLELLPGWDSYGAAAVFPGHVESACSLYCSVMRPSIPLPKIVPTSRGGIQLEWDSPELFIEVETLSRNRFGVLVEDKRSGGMEEFEFHTDLTPLLKHFDRLSNAG